MNVKKVIFILLSAAILLITGCNSHVELFHVGHAGRKDYNDRLVSLNGISSNTTNLLGNYLLSDLLKKNPEQFIPTLERLLDGDRKQEVRIALAETALLIAEKKIDVPDCAVGYYLTVLIHTQNYLTDMINTQGSDFFNPDIQVAIRAYNIALAELFTYLQERKLHTSNSFELTAAGGQLVRFAAPQYKLPVKKEHIRTFHLCADYRTGNLTHNNRRFGLGVQLICELGDNAMPETVFAEEQVIPGTLIIDTRKESGTNKQYTASLLFLDSRSTDTIPVKNFMLPLALDFSTPLAYMVRKPPAVNFLKRAFLIDTAVAYEGLYHLEPHHDDRIPVVLVHGLMSDIRTWMQMLNTLLSDPVLRKHYRFMGYTYSSGNPIVYSASNLRKALDKEREKLQRDGRNIKNFDRMVVIGHSMGGLLTRMLISSSDEKLLNDYLGRDFYKNLRPDHQTLVRELLFFKPHISIQRVVFIAVPHRGAALADSWLGHAAASMVKLPKAIIDFNKDLLDSLVNSNNNRFLKKTGILTGIDNLSPENSALSLMRQMPMADIPLHSIIGNKSKGNIPGGSDGVVPYHSSHLNEVRSEKVVYSGHSVQQNPLAIQEIRRILREHLKSYSDIKLEQ